MAAVLFVHQSFPSQFDWLADALVARGFKCAAIGQAHARDRAGVRVERYELPGSPVAEAFPPLLAYERDLLRGRAALEAARRLEQDGFRPDVIVGHTGWGETLHLREVFPDARIVAYPEFIPQPHGFSLGFDPEFAAACAEDRLFLAAANAGPVLALSQADAIVCPTAFQASSLPAAFQPMVRVIHEGVDLAELDAVRAATVTLPNGVHMERGAPLVTHVNRNLEPYRGMHILARALPRLLEEVPDAQVLVIGNEDRRGYGGTAPGGLTWKAASLRGTAFDASRVHFVGLAPRRSMLAAIRTAAAHVYYTYPFVLSWSLVEAMGLGAYVIGSDTPPVRELIQNCVNGRLLPFFDPEALATALVEACRDPASSNDMRRAARQTIADGFTRERALAEWLALLAEMGASNA